MWIRICLIANVVPYWNLLICIWCYFIIQWNKWVKYYCICVYKIPLNSYKSTWAKGSSTIVIMCCLSSVRDYFKHYWLFRNCWTEFNEILQEFKQSSTKGGDSLTLYLGPVIFVKKVVTCIMSSSWYFIYECMPEIMFATLSMSDVTSWVYDVTNIRH